MSINLRELINKLDHESRSAVEGAAGLCLTRTHYDVEIEHVLLKLLETSETDFDLILQHYEVDRSQVSRHLVRELDHLKTGNAKTPALSPSLVRLLTEAWTLGSVNMGAGSIRTGHVVLALRLNDEMRRICAELSVELDKVKGEDLLGRFDEVTGRSTESANALAHARPPSSSGARRTDGDTPSLDQFTLDLTAKARAGDMDPVLGRDSEIRHVVDILTRRRQNNPILVGEAGVGKTAVVEGFALRIAHGDVPPALQNVTIRTLDLALLQAGAGMKGEFESRLKGLIEEVMASPTPIILFIDEAHTLIGAGGTAGQGDAANLLKPALARGELRTVAATTWAEYKKYFEKDPALTRRFQVVKVEEPTEEKCMIMMRGVAPHLERHHGVRILDDGLAAAVRLSHRYLPDRQLPDKAVTVLDTACARLALGQGATPALIEDARRTLDDLDLQERVLRREEVIGVVHSERLRAIGENREQTLTHLAAMTERWELERSLVQELKRVQAQLEAGVEGPGAAGNPASYAADPTASGAHEKLRAELRRLDSELEALQGESPMVPVHVDADLVSQVISGWTGIPVGKMLRDDLKTALDLEHNLQRRIVGQEHALEIISRRIRTSKAGIDDPGKPVGVFLLVGPSGVGKTETALALADLLYGGERNVITINMSEFQEAHTVSTLKGSPPGYVGYGEGGVLTEAVRRRPHSVVLLDEVEKAHPDVLELFFQVFDKGRMEDGEGREIDFKNTTIILTSNAGTDMVMKLCADPETMPSPEGMVSALKPELDKIFKPAFLGRTVITPYFPLQDSVLRTIIDLKLEKVRARLLATHRVSLILDDAVKKAIAERCTEVESGARNVDNILTNTLLPSVSQVLLGALAEGTVPVEIHVDVGENGDFVYRERWAEG